MNDKEKALLIQLVENLIPKIIVDPSVPSEHKIDLIKSLEVYSKLE